MRITLDSNACQGHGRCYALAPTLFDTDDEGYAVLLVDGEVPADLIARERGLPDRDDLAEAQVEGVRVVDGEDALVEVLDVLERRRQLEVQAGLVDDLADLAKGKDHGELPAQAARHALGYRPRW